MNRMPYMDEPWYALLAAAAKRETRHTVAQRLGLSDSLVTQVLNGTGCYGSGAASTKRVADRVLHKFGSYPCPHLTEQYGEERVISSDECRSYAHRATAPIGSPGLMQHWKACMSCPHKALSAPAPPAEPKAPRQRRKPAAKAPATSTTTSTEEA